MYLPMSQQMSKQMKKIKREESKILNRKDNILVKSTIQPIKTKSKSLYL